MTVSRNTVDPPTVDELESAFVNNDDLQKIEAYLARFNPIRVMGMAHMEIRHSSILAWLLSPDETHGLGDGFLKAFLGEALRGQHDATPSALEIAQADLRDAQVRREWRSIDIFILSPRNGWAFVIENKFFSRQHDGQLAGYKTRAIEALSAESAGASDQSEMHVRGIFLTLDDEVPQDNEFATIHYDAICKFLGRFLAPGATVMASEVRTFLNHYLDVLEVETGVSREAEEMEKLARDLYRAHRKAMDFIIEHGSGSAFFFAARHLLKERATEEDGTTIVGGRALISGGQRSDKAWFIIRDWNELFRAGERIWPGCKGWWMEVPLVITVSLKEDKDGEGGTLRIQVEVGPLTPPTLRARLIAAIKEAAERKELQTIQFQSAAAEEGRRFSKFIRKNNTASIKDVHDSDEIMKQIEVLIQRQQKELNVVTEALQSIDWAFVGKDGDA